MTPPDAEALISRLNAYAGDPEIIKLQAQAHARAILQELGSPRIAWPRFRADLDQRLFYGAHFQIWSALELLDAGKSRLEAQEALSKGAESLEFLCEDPNLDPEVRTEQLLKAAFAYYIAGHYARSFVIIGELSALGEALPRPLSLLLSIMQKRLQAARQITVDVFQAENLTDSGIASELEAGVVDEDEALSRVVFSSLSSAVSLYLEYLKTGDRALFEDALDTANDMILVSRESMFVDLWWWSFCLRHLLMEYDRGSLWTNLGATMLAGTASALPVRYIRAGLRRHPPIIELWPSQVQAVPIINRADRPHFCLKMPTSSGKTQIAELTILQFLMDKGTDPHWKCAYIAPFRSLAVEIEKTLQKSIGRLGARVSEIYGGFDLSSEDRKLIEKTNVLVATPEKFDALFRFAPDLGSEIGLVIIDEGHIVDPNERGLNFEFFLQRLLKRLAQTKCRFVFISAVLPNAEEFAEWITGSPKNLVESEWRPSRLMLGQLSWDGNSVRIDYTHSGKEDFEQECFVPGFIAAVPCKGVEGLGRRRLPFPTDKDEAFATAALQFARSSTTLVFCPQKRQAQSFALKIKNALLIRQALERARGKEFELPKPGVGTPAWERCRTSIESEMGSASELLGLLEAGIVVHHAGLPQRVRLAIEDLVRNRGVQLVVATNTLAQGVNLPIKTVLVRGLHHGHNELVSPLTFWNISGRAGRGMQETEGQILFCVDKTAPSDKRSRTAAAIRQMISALDTTKVASAIRLLLFMFADKWKRTHPGINISELCIHLAENDLEWIAEDSRAGFQGWLDRLDGHLLALTEDFDLDPYTPERLQQVLSGSLLFIQLRDGKESILTSDEAVAFFGARISYIYKKHPEKVVRSRLFKLGLPMSDCETIETNKDELLLHFLRAIDWATWDVQHRLDYLVGIAEIVLKLKELSPREGSPEQRFALLKGWLSGNSSTEMAAYEETFQFSKDPAEISLWLEDVCKYRLPWGTNSVSSFLKSYAAAQDLEFPAVCSHFASMFKFGVRSRVAVRLMPYLDQDRNLATTLANACPLTIDELDKVRLWFTLLDRRQLDALGLDSTAAARIMEHQLAHSSYEPIANPASLRIRLSFPDIASTGGIGIGHNVLIIPSDEEKSNGFAVWTVKGKRLGSYTFSEHLIPEWWKRPDLVVSTVSQVDSSAHGQVFLTVDTSEI